MASHDIEETRRATRKYLAEIAAAAVKAEGGDAASAAPTPPVGAATPVSSTPASPVKGGGGGGAGTPPSGGGGSGGHGGGGVGKFFEGLTFEKLIPLLIGLMLAFGSVYWSTHDTPPNKSNENVAGSKNMSDLAGLLKGDNSSTAKPVITLPEKTVITSSKSFKCEKDDEVMSGFLRASVEHIDTGRQTLRIQKGCLLVRFARDINSLSGNYVAFVPNRGDDSAVNKWRFCGNGSPAPQYNFSSAECVRMVNENMTEDIRFVVYTSLTID